MGGRFKFCHMIVLLVSVLSLWIGGQLGSVHSHSSAIFSCLGNEVILRTVVQRSRDLRTIGCSSR